MTNTTAKLNLYRDALERWQRALRDYPYLANPEPKASDFGVDQWVAGKVREMVVKEFERKF